MTSKYAVELYKEHEATIENIAGTVKAKAGNVEHRIVQLLEEKKELQDSYDKLKAELQQSKLNDLSDATTEVNGVSVIRKEVEAGDAKDLRAQMDLIKSQNQDSIIALAAVTGDKVSLVVTVPKELTPQVRAGDIMKGMANIVDGKGGGRPDMAQGGGTNVGSITAALQFVDEYIKDFL